MIGKLASANARAEAVMALLSFVPMRQARTEAGQDMFSIRISRRGVWVRHPLCLWWCHSDHPRPPGPLGMERSHCFGIERFNTSRRLKLFREGKLKLGAAEKWLVAAAQSSGLWRSLGAEACKQSIANGLRHVEAKLLEPE